MNFNFLLPFKIPDGTVMLLYLGFLSRQGMRWWFRVCVCSAAIALPLVYQSAISELSVCACSGLCCHALASCVVENESIASKPQRSNACYEDTVTIWVRTAAGTSGQNLITANWWSLSNTTNLWKIWSLAILQLLPVILLKTFCSSDKSTGWKGSR